MVVPLVMPVVLMCEHVDVTAVGNSSTRGFSGSVFASLLALIQSQELSMALLNTW